MKQKIMQVSHVKKLHQAQLKVQSGLVLFVALIALVVMSLAAAALIRSVDSGVLVAGNLAFKQSALMATDNGIAEAYRFITDTPAALNNTNANGYSSQYADIANIKSAALWTNANSKLAPTDPSDLTNNETRFIIQRMCRNTGIPDGTHCLMGDTASGANSKGGQCQGGCAAGGSGAGGLGGNSGAAMYRVTVRVIGPKNTASYLQAFIY